MTLFNIINPSDDMTFHAPDTQVAALAMFLLSNGQYGADCVDKSCEDVPIFLMGGAQTWWKARFDQSIETMSITRAAEVSDALQSIQYGLPKDRADYDADHAAQETDAERAAFAAIWVRKHQSAQDDIRGRALELASLLREKYADAA